MGCFGRDPGHSTICGWFALVAPTSQFHITVANPSKIGFPSLAPGDSPIHPDLDFAEFDNESESGIDDDDVISTVADGSEMEFDLHYG